MSKNMMRRGASILIAVTIGVGGLTIGTGVAGAEGSAEGSSGAGSGELLPDKIGQQLLRVCDPTDVTVPIRLLIPCWDPTVDTRTEIGDFTMLYVNPKSVVPQGPARYRIEIARNSESGGDAAFIYGLGFEIQHSG